MVDEVTIEDLKPKEDKFTLSDFFTDDDDVVTDLGDDISLCQLVIIFYLRCLKT